MTPADRLHLPPPPNPPDRSARFALPAWLLSLTGHALLLVLFAVSIQLTPRGAAEEAGRDVGIVLRRREAPREYFQPSEVDAEFPADSQMQSEIDELAEDLPDAAPASALPDVNSLVGPTVAERTPTRATDLTGGPSTRGGAPSGGATRTAVFGIEGEGNTFVYVFDRSGSMGGVQRSSLSVAKLELLASLASLAETDRFQIIFYNEKPSIFQPSGLRAGMAFATPQYKNLAERFVSSITADGATEHESALHAALKLAPDVIFFLTDADQPALTPHQLSSIRKRAAGRTAIHAIQFGLGRQLDDDNFLMRLARENHGRYRYVDITTFSRR